MCVYVPDKVATNPLLVVVVHSCQSTAQSYSQNIKIPWKQGSYNKGYITSLSHPGGGDFQAMTNMIIYAIDKYNTDPTHIYVTGGSSGAMMSHVKASADQLKKVVLGVYPSNGGPRPKMQIWHGNDDSTLAPLNYQETIKQWTGVFDGISAQGVGHSVPANLARQCGVVWIVRTSLALLLLNGRVTWTAKPPGLYDESQWGLPHSPAPSLSRLGICPSEKDRRTSSIDWLNALGFDTGFTVLGKKPSIKAIQSLKDVMPVSFAVGFVAAARNTTSSQTRKIERAPVPWVVVLFVCSTTLMALGIAGVYQSFQVRASDVFDPMRGLTYDNPYMDLPSSGTMLHASARAQLSQNV
ncbi:hypothetical protein AB5N19_10116 [Seiridium cardinale]